MRLLFKVEDVFTVPGRGCVIVPGETDVDFHLKADEPIQLRRPDGRVIDTSIKSIELVTVVNSKCRIAFLLPDDVTKADVRDGTEIWIEG